MKKMAGLKLSLDDDDQKSDDKPVNTQNDQTDKKNN
jgi:hypothetical protein